MSVRSRVGAALLALFLAGCSAVQAQPGATFSVTETKPAVVHGLSAQISPMALQFLSAKVGFMAVAKSAWSDGSQAPVLARLLLATADGGRT